MSTAGLHPGRDRHPIQHTDQAIGPERVILVGWRIRRRLAEQINPHPVHTPSVRGNPLGRLPHHQHLHRRTGPPRETARPIARVRQGR